MSDVSRAAVFARIVRDAVEALEQLGAGGVGERRVGLHPGALLAHEERDHLELDAVGRARACRAAPSPRPRAPCGRGSG